MHRKLHLHSHHMQQSLGIKEGIGLLENSLRDNNKKYVILFPRKKGSIDYAKEFLDKQKPSLITTIFNVFAYNIFALLSLASSYLGMKTIHNPL